MKWWGILVALWLAGCSSSSSPDGEVRGLRPSSTPTPSREVAAQLVRKRLQACSDYLNQRRGLGYAFAYQDRLEKALLEEGCTQLSERIFILSSTPQSLGSVRGPGVDWASDTFFENNCAALNKSIQALQARPGKVPAEDLEDFERRFAALRAYEPSLETVVQKVFRLAAREGLLSRREQMLELEDDRIHEQLTDYSWRTGELAPDEMLRPERDRLLQQRQALQQERQVWQAQVDEVKKWQAPQFLVEFGDRRAPAPSPSSLWPVEPPPGVIED